MRPEKPSIVSDLSERLTRSLFVLVTDYQRMNVNHFADLRTRLAASGAEMHVVKNSFLKRAMTDSGLPDVGATLTGQTAIVTGKKDVAPVAKVLKMFAAEFKISALKIGIVDKSILSTQDLEALAELPSREILLSQLLGLLLSPATKLVRVLNEPAAAFARLLNAKKEAMPPTPEASAPVPSEAAPGTSPQEPAAASPEAAAATPEEAPPAAPPETAAVAAAETPPAASPEAPAAAPAETPAAAPEETGPTSQTEGTPAT
jgi:large subunit ribosomal protein L10